MSKLSNNHLTMIIIVLLILVGFMASFSVNRTVFSTNETTTVVENATMVAENTAVTAENNKE